MNGKIFAIGDIHGCAAKLELLLNRLPFDRAQDTLVFLGDYLDRGPDAKGVLDQICQLRAEGVHVVTLMGNHEYLLLEYHQSGDQVLLPYLRRLGMENTLESYGCASPSGLVSLNFMPKEHRDFLASLLPYWETEEYIFVHAGLRHDQPLVDQDISDLCEVRDPFLSHDRDYGRRVIFGHTPFATPLLTPYRTCIDTGAVYGNLLTAVELPGLRFHHAA
ncbi:MAG: metallophosphoesterase [Desulfobulbaceae bacterium]|nr:metallophosphoesterase [Desulfobulbaceae bacterium]HIJ89967.1 serine/threonine protein phosphatase [Deltaproteobacteria bacterium]